MRLGIHPILKRDAGGIYQYSVTMLRAIDALVAGQPGDQWTVLAHDTTDPALRALRNPCWSIRPFRRPGSGPGSAANSSPDPDRPAEQPDMRAWLEECGINLMVYPAPHRLSFESGVPFVMAVHDLQHRLQPEFPEVSADGEWNRREYLFRNAARQATLLIAESEVGRDDILRFYGEYGVTRDQVKVLPYLPATPTKPHDPSAAQTLRRKYNLPERFFFYPAQFWPHKNHLRIVQALGILRAESNLQLPVVFCGAHSGALRERTHDEVRQAARQLGVADQVFDLGYVADEDLPALYEAALALLMPTFFGPTNIPILEAWAHGCPVITSDIRGVREQAGEAAVLVDPASIESIAAGMERLSRDEALCSQLIARGRRRVTSYCQREYQERLAGILAEAKERVRDVQLATTEA